MAPYRDARAGDQDEISHKSAFSTPLTLSDSDSGSEAFGQADVIAPLSTMGLVDLSLPGNALVSTSSAGRDLW